MNNNKCMSRAASQAHGKSHIAAEAHPTDVPNVEGHTVPHQYPTDTQGVAIPQATASFLDEFFSELKACGVHDAVVSPGSRSTSLAMKAFEHFGDVYVDIDERSAAFFALGLAKAKNAPVCVICTSGTAVGNWMPAVLEAESSRVPLLFLSSDRPARLQEIGAPQTCDQLHMFGTHVKKFIQMPLPDTDPKILLYARHMAMEMAHTAAGYAPGVRSSDAGPVHINFPFDKPLKPTMGHDDAWYASVQNSEKAATSSDTETAVSAHSAHFSETSPMRPHIITSELTVSSGVCTEVTDMIAGKHAVAVCGEGSAETPDQVQSMIAFAHAFNLPLLADPLSGLRCSDDLYIIDNYDNIFSEDYSHLVPDVFIRFGRWPVSKSCGIELGSADIQQIAVDVQSTRDMNAHTDVFIQATPQNFVRAMVQGVKDRMATRKTENVKSEFGGEAKPRASEDTVARTNQKEFARAWIDANDAERKKIISVAKAPDKDSVEGAYVSKLLEEIPEHSLLFSASSMSIRALDTFYVKSNKQMTLLCNRGLNGIDGTVSSAIGAGQMYDQSTLLIGDLAMQHDAGGLALQNEMKIRAARGHKMHACTIVVLDNDGGAIFDMLPQASHDDYFKRLFLTPQNTDFISLAAGYHVNAVEVSSVASFARAYTKTLGRPGIHMIVIHLPLQGVAKRYAPYK